MTFSAFCVRCRKKVKKAERIIRYFDMFAGVGGFRAGLNLAGGFQCIGHCEIDKYADASYRAIHAPGKEEVYYPDARTIDPKELPDFDLLCGGFPCQAFSTAGRRKGFEDARGTLFFELARVVKEKRPPYLFLKTCLDSFRMTEAGRLVSSSPRFMTWGIMSNGLCLTANILESLNQDGGCSLSDILIPDAPEKYFLSLEQMQKLLYRSSMDGWANESMILPESPAHRTPADSQDSTL